MPRVDARPLAGEQGEALVEAGRQRLDADRAHPRRRQLDRQRQPVEPPADLRHRRQAALVELEARARLGGAVGEQLRRRRRTGPRRRRAGAPARRSGASTWTDSPGKPERLPTGRQHGQPQAVSAEALDQGHDGTEDVLAVVEHAAAPPGRG